MEILEVLVKDLVIGIIYAGVAIFIFWLYFAKNWKQRAETAENAFKQLLRNYRDACKETKKDDSAN